MKDWFWMILLITIVLILGVAISYGFVHLILFLIFKLLGYSELFKWQYSAILYLIIILIKPIFSGGGND